MGEQRLELLRIGYDAASVPEGGCLIVSSVASFTKTIRKEPAGSAFHTFALRQAGVYGDDGEDDSAASVSDTEAQSTSTGPALNEPMPEGVSWSGKKKKQKRSKEKHDYYALLGLENDRWLATESQIQKAYRKKALEHHPDKALAGLEDEGERERVQEHFLLIQEAYENLSEPAKRREYDSVDEFDDSLPESCAPEDFYRVFGPAFRRQSRWSVATPVPELGDDNAPNADVDGFYGFWFAFKSWREFPHPDEEDVEQAEGREHRRWIERYNSKLREKAKKEETRRLKQFVEAAFSLDPRMVRRRAEEKAQKDRRKQERYLARNATKLEAERKAAEEAERAAAAEAAAAVAAGEAKKLRQTERKAMQKERSRLRTICATPHGGARLIGDYETEQLCARMTLGELQGLCVGLYADGIGREQMTALLQDAEALIDGSTEAERAAKEAQRREQAAEATRRKAAEEAEAAARAAAWDGEEVRLLEKALVKYPVGTAKRWDQVAAYVRTRTVDEVIEMAKHGLAAGKGAPRQDTFTVLKKHAANVVIKSDATARDEVFTDVQVNLSGAAVHSNGSAPLPAETDSLGSSQTDGPPPTANGAHPASAENGSADTAASGGADADDWLEGQNAKLVAAMKKYGKAEPERWTKIAAMVPGKTPSQCIKRFKSLRDTVRAKKASDS